MIDLKLSWIQECVLYVDNYPNMMLTALVFRYLQIAVGDSLDFGALNMATPVGSFPLTT